MESLDLGHESVVTCLPADEYQELAEGIVDHAALFGSVLAGCLTDRVGLGGELEVLNGGLHQADGDVPASGLLNSALPSCQGLLGAKADQGPKMGFAFWFAMSTNCRHLRKHLGCK